MLLKARNVSCAIPWATKPVGTANGTAQKKEKAAVADKAIIITLRAFVVLTLTRTTGISKLNALLFPAADGTVVSAIFRDPVCAPYAAPVATNAAPAGELPSDLDTAEMDECPGSPKPDLWNGRRTRFLIEKYKELNSPLVGTKGGFR